MTLSLTQLTKTNPPRVRFDLLKDKILGKKYDLSLVFANPSLSRRLNSALRKKDHPTNVLSFPLSKTSGEIFLDLRTIKKEVEKFNMSFEKLVTYLFIHGLLHLKGMEHGAKMTEAEKKYLNGATNSSWY